MITDTINDVVTMAGGTGALLANRYRVVRQLGQGGMGSVWLAEDTQLDDKTFAIKMLPSILVSNKRAYRQLKDEALVAMQLVHPNIVQIRAFEENDGNPFLVMDYVDGQTLDDYLAEHAHPLGEAASRRFDSASMGEAASRRFNGTTGILPVDILRILRPIAAALDYAHAKGVVHRDVKPGNVMIAKDGTPYILDFGIAREIQETMTRVTGKLSSGTLLYMSPEQLMGEKPTPAQDIYSFAAMAYECLKGEPPFVRGAIEDQIKNKQPDPLPTEILTGKAAILAAGVMAGLAKKPEDRPPTCEAVLRGSGTLAAPDGAVNGSGKSAASPNPQQSGGPRSYATAVILVLAVAILAFVGGIFCVVRKNDNQPVYESAPKTMAVDTPVQKTSVEHADAVTNEVPGEAIPVGETPGIISGTTNYVGGTNVVNRPSPIKRPPLISPPLVIIDQPCDTNVVSRPSPIKRPDTYKVQPGDSLQRIAQRFYGSRSKWRDIQKANIATIPADGRLRVGQELRLPSEPEDGHHTNVTTTARAVAKVNGRKVEGARFKIGDKVYIDPTWNSLKPGQRVPGGDSSVEYSENGRRYVGTLHDRAVDWMGPRELVVELKEYTGPTHREQKTLILPGGATMEMIYVEPQRFAMGSANGDDDEKPVHDVRLMKGYWLGKTEVTQGQWKSVLPGQTQEWLRDRVDSRYRARVLRGVGDNNPVCCVSWKDCQNDFLPKIQDAVREQFPGFKATLPTEAQWECACRAETTGDYAGGDLDDLAWYSDNSGCSTHPVGQKRANAWGFCDMHGNVWEWCADAYDASFYSSSRANVDPFNAGSTGARRVYRGSSFDSGAGFCRFSSRGRNGPDDRRSFLGFRVALVPSP